MLRRAHRSRNGTLPFGTNKEQQLALMQQQTKDPQSKDPQQQSQSLPASEDSYGRELMDNHDEDDGKLHPEFIPPSSASASLASVASSVAQDVENRLEVRHLEASGHPMEVQMEDDDRRSHMDLMAENNPIDDDDEDEGLFNAQKFKFVIFLYSYCRIFSTTTEVQIYMPSWSII